MQRHAQMARPAPEAALPIVLVCWRREKTFVPLGFLCIDKITQGIRNVLETCTAERFDKLVATTASNPEGWPRKHTFTALFWHANNAAERLQRLPLHVLKQKRQKCIDEKNDLYRQYGKDGDCPAEITTRKQELRREREQIEKIIEQRMKP